MTESSGTTGTGSEEVSQIFQKKRDDVRVKKIFRHQEPFRPEGQKNRLLVRRQRIRAVCTAGKGELNKDKDVTLVQQDFTMNQLENDKIDVAQAMSYNEFGLLLEASYSRDDLYTIDVNAEGVAMLEDCLFAKSDWLSENKDLAVQFLKASIKGWADACGDPESTGKTVYQKDKSVSLEHQTYMAKEVAKLVVPDGFDKAKIGYIDEAALKRTADMALKYGLLKQVADLSKCVDTAYWKEATA